MNVGQGPIANRPLVTNSGVAEGDEYHATDTGQTYLCVPNGLGQRVWALIAGGPFGTAAWGNYVVAPAGSAYNAPYSSIQTAVTAASGAGDGLVLVMPGTYTENLIFAPGVAVVGFAPGSRDEVPRVTVIGHHSVVAVGGTLLLANLRLVGDSGATVLSYTGGSNVTLQLRGVHVAPAGVASVGVVDTGAGTLIVDDCQLALDPTGGVALNTTAATLIRDSRVGSASNVASMILGAGTVSIVDSQIIGPFSKSSGSADWRGGSYDATGAAPTITGTATWTYEGVDAGNGLTFATTNTVTGRRVVPGLTITTIVAAGPHAIPANMADVTLFGSVLVPEVANLPDVKEQADGNVAVFKNLGSDTVTLTPFAGNTIDGNANLILNPGDEATLCALRAGSLWIVLAR